MDKIHKRLYNQALGLLPLLFFMFLDNYLPYLTSFVISVAASFIGLIFFRLFVKDAFCILLLLPTAIAQTLYLIFLFLKLEPVLFLYSPLLVEIILVVVLACFGFMKKIIIRSIRNYNKPLHWKTDMRTLLNESYFIAQITQNLYIIHIFILLVYTILPSEAHSQATERFLYRELGLIIGIAIILYGQIRLSIMRGSLKKEMWLPVLSDDGKVIGCIARSVSRSLPKKYYHPVIRIAVVYKGLLYLTPRMKDAFVSPNTLDHPFRNYVLFHHSIDNTVREAIGFLSRNKNLLPRPLVNYTFENDKVKHFVSLYVICIHNESDLDFFKHPKGKIWTEKQIDQNLGKDVFSEYFEKEYPYLQNTILLAEQISCHSNQNS